MLSKSDKWKLAIKLQIKQFKKDEEPIELNSIEELTYLVTEASRKATGLRESILFEAGSLDENQDAYTAGFRVSESKTDAGEPVALKVEVASSSSLLNFEKRMERSIAKAYKIYDRLLNQGFICTVDENLVMVDLASHVIGIEPVFDQSQWGDLPDMDAWPEAA